LNYDLIENNERSNLKTKVILLTISQQKLLYPLLYRNHFLRTSDFINVLKYIQEILWVEFFSKKYEENVALTYLDGSSRFWSFMSVGTIRVASGPSAKGFGS
jgi:hypothetical protein